MEKVAWYILGVLERVYWSIREAAPQQSCIGHGWYGSMQRVTSAWDSGWNGPMEHLPSHNWDYLKLRPDVWVSQSQCDVTNEPWLVKGIIPIMHGLTFQVGKKSVVYPHIAYLQRKSKSCWRIKSVSCSNLLDHWVCRIKIPICFPLLLFWSPGISFRQVLPTQRPRDMSSRAFRSAGSRMVSVSSQSCGILELLACHELSGVEKPCKHMGVCQYLLLSMLVGSTPIYQLFWCSSGL